MMPSLLIKATTTAAIAITMLTIVSLHPSAAAVRFDNTPDAATLTSALYRAGLDPSSIAAAGVNGSGATAIVNNVKQYLTDHPNDLSTADTNYCNAKVSADSLRRIVQSGTATSEQLTQYQAASSTLDTATTARATALASIVTAGVANVSNDQKTALQNIAANQSWGVSIEYTATSATEAQWVALRNALAVKRINTKYGVSVPDGVTTLIATWDAKTDVAAATTAFDSNLASVTTAWNNAVGQ
ncbi:MAG: hypothetical protein HY286_09160 [Planctomycetes bacterium]|nr:hypothetical protein [Planctomycetota bacterium]